MATSLLDSQKVIHKVHHKFKKRNIIYMAILLSSFSKSGLNNALHRNVYEEIYIQA